MANLWTVKSEPSDYSFEQLQQDVLHELATSLYGHHQHDQR